MNAAAASMRITFCAQDCESEYSYHAGRSATIGKLGKRLLPKALPMRIVASARVRQKVR
jgi:hypothetical protein